MIFRAILDNSMQLFWLDFPDIEARVHAQNHHLLAVDVAAESPRYRRMRVCGVHLSGGCFCSAHSHNIFVGV